METIDEVVRTADGRICHPVQVQANFIYDGETAWLAGTEEYQEDRSDCIFLASSDSLFEGLGDAVAGYVTVGAWYLMLEPAVVSGVLDRTRHEEFRFRLRNLSRLEIDGQTISTDAFDEAGSE